MYDDYEDDDLVDELDDDYDDDLSDIFDDYHTRDSDVELGL